MVVKHFVGAVQRAQCEDFMTFYNMVNAGIN